MDLARGQSVKRFPQTLVALAALRKILRLRWRPSKDELSGPQATGKCSTKDFIPATAPSRSLGGIAFLIYGDFGVLAAGIGSRGQNGHNRLAQATIRCFRFACGENS